MVYRGLKSFGVKNFVSLPDGTLLNVNAIAYIGLTEGDPPSFGVHLTALASGDSPPLCLAGELSGEEAREFLNALGQAGIDVNALKKHMNLPLPKARMMRVTGL